MVVVPRLFEVLRTRITKAIEKQGKLSNYLLDRAVSIGGKQAAGGVPIYDQPMNLIVKRCCSPRSRSSSAGGSRRWCRAARRSIPRSASSSSRSA